MFIIEFPSQWFVRVVGKIVVATGDKERATKFETPEAALAAMRMGKFKRDAVKGARIIEV